MSIKPISPSEARKEIPEFVIEAVNELINENMVERGSFDIRQQTIIDRVKTKTERDFDNRWLDFEPLFRSAGWNVSYDRPGYNESYQAYYTFSAK